MRVLLIEDDDALGELLVRVLEEEGAAVQWRKTVAAGLAETAEDYDVVVLDWMLPDGDGLAFCEALAQRSSPTPILMLTARGEVDDRVRGLRSGADDYVVKPFEIAELLARLEALTRRNKRLSELRSGEVVIDRLRRRCTVHDQLVELTAREYELLLRLALADGATVTRSALLQDVWKMTFEPGSGVLDVHVSRLRDKLGPAASRLETVRGVGYRWVAPR
ncbi:MAG: response regulator transcription factor [Alphaproteobacteria bacterium]|nr:response regulator transcription factor [Alphaproteobacteria bacterium]